MKEWTIEEIEKLMEGITDGEWCTTADGYNVKSSKDIMICLDAEEDRIPSTRWCNAAFIAAAPSIIRSLLEQLKDYQNRIESFEESSKVDRDIINKWIDSHSAMAKQLQIEGKRAQELSEQLKEKAREVVQEFFELLDAIQSDSYGITVCDVGRKNWFDRRDEIREKYGV